MLSQVCQHLRVVKLFVHHISAAGNAHASLKVGTCVHTCLVAEAEHEHVNQVAGVPVCFRLAVGEVLGPQEDCCTSDVPVASQRRRHVRLRAGVTIQLLILSDLRRPHAGRSTDTLC